jgi:hypothetical protein
LAQQNGVLASRRALQMPLDSPTPTLDLGRFYTGIIIYFLFFSGDVPCLKGQNDQLKSGTHPKIDNLNFGLVHGCN